MALPESTRLYLMAPVVRGRKGEYPQGDRRSGRRRATSASRSTARSTRSRRRRSSTRNSSTTSTWWSIGWWSRRISRRGWRIVSRQALKLADGLAIAEFADKPLGKDKTEGANKSKNDTHERMIFSERFACPVSGFTIEEIEPRLFSFNAPAGACPTCDGLGTELKFEADLIVPDTLAVVERRRDLAVGEDGQSVALLRADTARDLRRTTKSRWRRRSRSCRRKCRTCCCLARARTKSTFVYEDGVRTYRTEKPFEGVVDEHRAALARDR